MLLCNLQSPFSISSEFVGMPFSLLSVFLGAVWRAVIKITWNQKDVGMHEDGRRNKNGIVKCENC